MPYTDILYSVDDFVATITLNRPDKLNAWTSEMDADVHHAVERAAADEAVRAIVITGAGRGFCAGADMSRLSRLSAGETPRAVVGHQSDGAVTTFEIAETKPERKPRGSPDFMSNSRIAIATTQRCSKRHNCTYPKQGCRSPTNTATEAKPDTRKASPKRQCRNRVHTRKQFHDVRDMLTQAFGILSRRNQA